MSFAVENPKKVTLQFKADDKKSKSRTQQSFRKDADINNIMAKYLKTGHIDHINRRQPKYVDFSEVGDFHQNMIMVVRAQEQFNALPARIRDRFRNDPAVLVSFLSDSRNRKEAEELGLVEPTTPPNIPDPKSTSSGPGVPADNPGEPAKPGA